MKIKNGTIFNSFEPLKKLAAMDLPVRVSYDFGRRLRKIQAQYDVIEGERGKLVKKYSGDTNAVPQEKIADFLKDFNELLGLDEEIDVLPIKLDDLASNGNKCSAQDLLALDWLLEKDEPAKKL